MFPSVVDPRDERLDEIEHRLAELSGLVNAAQGEMVELVGEALDEGLWQGWGIHTPAQWFAWKTGTSPHHARQVVKLAERRTSLPRATGALAAGELSLDQAAEIARHVPDGFDASATELAKEATVTQLRRTLPRYNFHDPADDRRDEGPVDRSADAGLEEQRDLSLSFDDTGTARLFGHLPADEAAVLDTALRAAREDLYRELADGLPQDAPRPRVDLVDALMSLAESYLRQGQAATPSSDRFVAYAHLEAGPGDDPAGIASLHLGPLLPAHLRRLLTCDATLRPVLERDGVPVSVGRDERVVPRRIRRLIEHRDGGCAIPGCGNRRNLDIHHITHWQDGGPTDTHNLVCLCRRHHRAHHRGVLGLAGDADRPDGITVTDARGRRLDPSGHPVSPRSRARGRPGREVASDDLSHAAGGLGLHPDPYVHPFGESFRGLDLHLAPDRPPESPSAGRPAA